LTAKPVGVIVASISNRVEVLVRCVAKLRFAFLVLLVAVALGYGASAAYASSLTWVSDVTFGGGAAVGTDGWAARNYIEVWRPLSQANCTVVWYEHTDGSLNGPLEGCGSNPQYFSFNDGYGKAFCHNVYNSEVWPYTCQTTS
jgi:hypothetical protein